MDDAPAVSRLLVEISQRLLLAGESPYRARAYARAAENLLTLTVPLADVIAQGRLREIPGVGAALAEVIRGLHEHGTTSRLEAMWADVPASVLEMLKIPGLAPEKIAHIHQHLGIKVSASSTMPTRCSRRLQPTSGCLTRSCSGSPSRATSVADVRWSAIWRSWLRHRIGPERMSSS